MKFFLNSNNTAYLRNLEEEFGEIIVDLNVEPKEVTVEIKDKEIETKFKEEMKQLGFEIIGE